MSVLNDGLNVIFPDYQISFPKVANRDLGKAALGHGISVAIDPKTGRTRGSGYRRYNSYGKAKRVVVPDIGYPATNRRHYTKEEIEEYKQRLLESYRKQHPNAGNFISVYHYPNSQYSHLVNIMQNAEKTKFPQSYGFLCNGHNCGTYSSDVARGIDPNTTRYHLPLTPNALGAFEYLKSLIKLPEPASKNGIINPVYK